MSLRRTFKGPHAHFPRHLFLPLAAFLLATAALLSAEVPPANSQLQFRRIFVAEEDLASQARGMIPLKRDEFERRTSAWAERSPNSSVTQVRVTNAVYSARLVGDQLVEGRAQLDILSAERELAVLPWDPCNLAIGKPMWTESPPRPARLGTGPDGGATILLVESSGQLLVPWSLQGKKLSEQETVFDVQLPKAPLSRLVLQLPANLSLRSEAGIVSRLKDDAAGSALLTPKEQPGSVNWLIELGGQSQSLLHITNALASPQREGLILARETATHVLSPVDISSEFGLQLDVHQAGLETLHLVVDASATVTGVRVSGVSLPWRTASAPGKEETSLQIDLPEPVSGAGHNVSVSLVTPLALDKAMRLPRMRLADCVWQEGTATIVVPASLHLQNIQLQEARQSAYSAASATQPEETYQFQYHSATGKVEIRAGQMRPHLYVVGGLVVRPESAQLAAVLQADLSVDVGECFEVQGITADEWVIDSIDTVPPDLLEERQYEPAGSRKYFLRLRFARPLTAKTKTRLVIRAHRPLPAEGETIAAPTLRLVQFEDLREEQLLVALRATDSAREFQLSGDLDVFRVDPESATPEEVSLLESSVAGILFRLNRQAEGTRIAMVPSDPRFSVNIESEALIHRRKVEHHVVARVTPTSSSLARILVRSSTPLPAAMRWKLAGAGDLTITTQTLLPAQAPPLAEEGQKEAVWELILSRPTTQPLSLEAAWETTLAEAAVLPLFSFPEAVAQDGMLRVEAGQGVPLAVETEGVKSVPIPLPAAGEYSDVRGLFRYEPGRRAMVTALLTTKEETLSAAWVNTCAMRSHYTRDGSGMHEITWQIENTGLDRFVFSIPQGARLMQVSIADEGPPVAIADSEQGQQYVSLPSRKRHPVVTLVLSTRAEPVRGLLSYRWSAPIVTTPLPVLDRIWRIKLPQGIDWVGSAPSDSESWYSLWKSRLWGIFQTPVAKMQSHQRTTESSEEYTLERPWLETEPLVLSVYSPGLMRGWGILLAIAAASAFFWLVPGRPTAGLAVAVAFASLALLAPLAYAPLAAGLFWGLSCGALLVLARPSIKNYSRPKEASSPSTRTMIASGVAGAILLGILAVHGLPASAAPGDENSKSAPAKVHRVVIPMDADKQPAGDYVYVPLDFYTLLYQVPEREGVPAWILRSAVYELEPAQNKTAPNIVTARLEIETLAERCQVALPLHRGEVHLLEGRATLDGEPIALAWDDAGSVLRAEIGRSGIYQLALGLSVPAKAENGTSVLSFAIPRTHRALLQVSSVEKPAEWSYPGAQGAIAISPEGNDMVVEVGPADRLTTRRTDSQSEREEGITEAEQLVWWKIRPVSVTADVLFRIRPLRGKLREIKIVADPRLRLLPLENSPRVARVWTEEAESTTYHLTLTEPATDQVELRGRFLVPDASGIGKLVIPQLEIVADRKLKQWHAISAGKEIAIVKSPEAVMTEHSPAEFAESWGASVKPPTLAFESSGQPPAFQVRPQETAVQTSEIIDIGLGVDNVELRYRADLTDIPSHRFQEIIDLPLGFQAAHVMLQEQESNVPVRWQLDTLGALTIHRGQAPSAAQRLLVQGTLPLASIPGKQEAVRLPGLRDVTMHGAVIRVYRMSSALATISGEQGMEPIAAPAGPPSDPLLGRLFRSYRSGPSMQPAKREFLVETKSNTPTAAYRLVTRMERSTARSWSALVNCEVSLENGSLDAIRLEVPPEWCGPFELSPAMEHQIVLLPGQTQRHLVIRPAREITDRLSLTIRGPLKLQAGETPHVPTLVPLDAKLSNSFVLLPSRLEDQDLQWQTSGLQAIGPGESQDSQLAVKGSEAFRVVAPRFEATLRKSSDLRGNAKVTIADITIRPLHSGTYWARATYYLIPGSRDDAVLQLPPGSRLVQVLIDESAAQVRRQAKGDWTIHLGPEQLPQKVVVIYDHPPEELANPTGQILAPPALQGIPVTTTAWSVVPPPGNQKLALPMQTVDGDARQVPLGQMAAIIRLVRETGDSTSAALPTRQQAAWLSHWRLEFTRANQAARLGVQVDDRLETDRKALEAEFDATLSRYSDIKSASDPAGGAVANQALPKPAMTILQHEIPGTVTVSFHSDAPRGLFQRLGLATILLGIAVAALQLHRLNVPREWFASSPAFVVAVFAAVLLALTPVALLALLPLAAAAWFSLRRPWPQGRSESSSSLVRPSVRRGGARE